LAQRTKKKHAFTAARSPERLENEETDHEDLDEKEREELVVALVRMIAAVIRFAEMPPY
jgi:hypothetical protein